MLRRAPPTSLLALEARAATLAGVSSPAWPRSSARRCQPTCGVPRMGGPARRGGARCGGRLEPEPDFAALGSSSRRSPSGGTGARASRRSCVRPRSRAPSRRAGRRPACAGSSRACSGCPSRATGGAARRADDRHAAAVGARPRRGGRARGGLAPALRADRRRRAATGSTPASAPSSSCAPRGRQLPTTPGCSTRRETGCGPSVRVLPAGAVHARGRGGGGGALTERRRKMGHSAPRNRPTRLNGPRDHVDRPRSWRLHLDLPEVPAPSVRVPRAQARRGLGARASRAPCKGRLVRPDGPQAPPRGGGPRRDGARGRAALGVGARRRVRERRRGRLGWPTRGSTGPSTCGRPAPRTDVGRGGTTCTTTSPIPAQPRRLLPLWDHVFRTFTPVSRVTIPARSATKLPWLLDGDAVRPDLTGTYVVAPRRDHPPGSSAEARSQLDG